MEITNHSHLSLVSGHADKDHCSARALSESSSTSDIEKQFLSFIHFLCPYPYPQSNTNCTDQKQVLLEIDADGYRYFLMRRRAASNPLELLSPRELEITRLVAEGLPNKIIGEQLQISTWTVSTHLRRIFAKTGVRSRTAMIAKIFTMLDKSQRQPLQDCLPAA